MMAVNVYGPFAWGSDAMDALHNAAVMEELTFMVRHAMIFNPALGSLRQTLRDLDGRLSGCEERLRRGDSDMVQLLTALNAMLMHFISGNDHEKLRGVKEGLDRYLAGR